MVVAANTNTRSPLYCLLIVETFYELNFIIRFSNALLSKDKGSPANTGRETLINLFPLY